MAWNVCAIRVTHGWSVYSRVRSYALSSSNIMSFFQLPMNPPCSTSGQAGLWPHSAWTLVGNTGSLSHSHSSSSLEIPLGLQFCEVILNSTLPFGPFFDLTCQRSGMISSPKPDMLPQFLLSLRGSLFTSTPSKHFSSPRLEPNPLPLLPYSCFGPYF